MSLGECQSLHSPNNNSLGQSVEVVSFKLGLTCANAGCDTQDTCQHGGRHYQPGESLTVGCRTCSCHHLAYITCRYVLTKVKLTYKIVLFQRKWQKVTYGKHTFTNYGSHIWNILPNENKSCTKIDEFKSLLKPREGSKCQCTMCNALSYYLWTVNILYYICVYVCI